MLRRIMSLGISLAILSATTFAFAEDVYITQHGIKFHKAGCSLVKNRDTQEVGLKEAKAQGLEPCKRCFSVSKKQGGGKPRTAKATKQGLVYVTANGKKYHRKDCRLIKNRDTKGVKLSEAQGKEMQSCSKCFLQEAKAK